MQFGGGIVSFTAAPTSGVPTLQMGTGTFGGGAQPDFQGIAALGVNMAAGYSNDLIRAQVAGSDIFRVLSNGQMTISNAISAVAASGDITFQPTMTRIRTQSATRLGLVIVGAALQTSDLLQNQDSGSVNHFGIANVGSGVSPIWALRVAPVANAASMAQAHVGGASTGKAIQVIDNSGTTIGWLQLLA